jgi:hypothetical protein
MTTRKTVARITPPSPAAVAATGRAVAVIAPSSGAAVAAFCREAVLEAMRAIRKGQLQEATWLLVTSAVDAAEELDDRQLDPATVWRQYERAVRRHAARAYL